MKLCAGQIASIKGEILENISRHKAMAKLAALNGAKFIIFPELSLTGYEPSLARELASNQEDPRLDDLQKLSIAEDITIGVGLPIRTKGLPLIGMIVLSPNGPRQTYCKQHLHFDELPDFAPGVQDFRLDLSECRIAPAICYESLLDEHSQKAFQNGANVYFASVAKSQRGVDKTNAHLPTIARKYAMTTLMSNAIGPSDNFVSYGCTAVWNKDGERLGQLSNCNEGILLFDTETHAVEEVYLK